MVQEVFGEQLQIFIANSPGPRWPSAGADLSIDLTRIDVEVMHIVILLTLGDAHLYCLARPVRTHEFIELGKAHEMAAHT